MNAIVLISGRIGKNATTTTFRNNRGVIEFDVASNDHFIDRESGEKKKTTSWHHIKIFVDEINDELVDRLEKGAYISATGALVYDTWKKNDTRFTRAYIDIDPDEIDIV